MVKLSAIDDLKERVRELEKYNTEHGKPPTRLGSAIRYLVENQDVIKELVERFKAKPA
jgi:hypothetical protein